MPSTIDSTVLLSLTEDTAFANALPWWAATPEQTAEAVALLAPYRRIAENWHRTNSFGVTGLRSDDDLERMFREPFSFPMSLPRFLTFVRGQSGTETLERKPESRDGLAAAVAVMRRREAQAIADREAAERRIAELEARVAAPAITPVTAPWGAEHPDWIPFWHQAAIDAEAHGNCGEYDRHAEEMSAPSRYWFRQNGYDLTRPEQCYDYSVSVRISAWITVSTHGTEVSRGEVRDAIDSDVDLGDISDYDIDDYSVNDQTTCDECEPSGSVWSNPTPGRY